MDHTTICVSGGFDPLHSGHIAHIKAAAALADRCIVILNGDGFLMRKKGYVFLPLEDRVVVVAGLRWVNDVIIWDDGTQHVAGAIRQITPTWFANGGDRSQVSNMSQEELMACEEVGCIVVGGVGGTDKKNSSSKLVANFRAKT